MKNKILFLDIDGPMIPSRSYMLPDQTKPIVMTFDPVATSLINLLCEEHGWNIVLHSSWIRVYGGEKTKEHCIKQGVSTEHFHEHSFCNEHECWRYNRVAEWLELHPEVDQYAIIDDEPYKKYLVGSQVHPENIEKHLVLVDFEDGILMKHYRQLHDGAWHR